MRGLVVILGEDVLDGAGRRRGAAVMLMLMRLRLRVLRLVLVTVVATAGAAVEVLGVVGDDAAGARGA